LAEAAPFLFQLNVPFFPTSAGVSFSAREAPFLTILTAIIADDNKKKFARQERFGKKRRRLPTFHFIRDQLSERRFKTRAQETTTR